MTYSEQIAGEAAALDTAYAAVADVDHDGRYSQLLATIGRYQRGLAGILRELESAALQRNVEPAPEPRAKTFRVVYGRGGERDRLDR
jgi:hypothetical protein